MSETTWHYSVSGQSFGPCSKEDIVARIRSGQLKATDHVWREGMSEWATVGSVDEFKGAAASVPPASGAPAPPAAGARRSHEIDY